MTEPEITRPQTKTGTGPTKSDKDDAPPDVMGEGGQPSQVTDVMGGRNQSPYHRDATAPQADAGHPEDSAKG